MTRLLPWLLGVALLCAWEWSASAWQWSSLVLPAPSRVGQALWQGLVSGFFWPHVWHTLREVLLGLTLGGCMGFGLGVWMGEWSALRRVLMPYVVLTQVVPKLALAPLFIVWFGFGVWPVVVITALICFFPLLENTLAAMQQVDPGRLELFRMLRATRWQTLWRLKLPAGLPTVLAGVRVAVVLALVGAVVGEFMVAGQGLGALIIAAQGSMDTALMFAVLVLITVLGWALYQGAGWWERCLLGVKV